MTPFNVVEIFNLPVSTTGSISGFQEFSQSSVLKLRPLIFASQPSQNDDPE
jgi:hypothetical protein